MGGGMVRRILEESLAYAKDRKQFGKPIGEFQQIIIGRELMRRG